MRYSISKATIDKAYRKWRAEERKKERLARQKPKTKAKPRRRKAAPVTVSADEVHAMHTASEGDSEAGE